MAAAGVTEKADDIAGANDRSTVELQGNRRQVKVLREDIATKMGDPHVGAARIVGALTLHVINHAIGDGVDVLAPQVTAQIHATVARRPASSWVLVRRPEDLALVHWHAARRPGQRIDP